MTDVRYPIGEFEYHGLESAEQCAERVRIIRDFPRELRGAVAGLTDAQLDIPHREGGWTVRQIVHHVGDVNVHIYCRVKAVMAEPRPLITGFEENDWIKTADVAMPIEPTLLMLEGTHARWATLLASVKHREYSRVFEFHGEGEVALDEQVAYAAWHCRHHLAQIANLRRRKGW